MKNRIAAALIAATAFAAPAMAQRAPAAVVVVVDTDRIYRDCNACRTAQTQLQSQVATLRTRQQTLETQLRPEGRHCWNLRAVPERRPVDPSFTIGLYGVAARSMRSSESVRPSPQGGLDYHGPMDLTKKELTSARLTLA